MVFSPVRLGFASKPALKVPSPPNASC